MSRPSVCLTAPFGLAVASLLVLAVLAVRGWPGEPAVAGVEFCERLQSGPVKQPANTWSNVGFFVVGLAVGGQAWRDVAARKARGWDNRMVSSVAFPASYACLSVLIGVGSAALHASTTRWAAELDLLAMHLWGAWCIAFATTRLRRASDGLFVSVFAGQVVALVARLTLSTEPRYPSGSSLFGAMIAAAIALELTGRWRNRRLVRMDNHHLAWAVGVFLVAYACWRASSAAGPWCDPDSLWQGHAVWHLLCAASVALVYLYGRSERSVVVPA